MTIERRTIVIKRGTAAEWAEHDDVLLDGELGALMQDGPDILKIGDGIHPFSALPQFAGGSGGGGTPSLTIGTVTTVSPGSPATASIVNGALNLGIPRGNAGADGAAGATGATGAAGATGATPSITPAATALAAGAAPTVTKTGTDAAPTLTFGIPAGATGATGQTGQTGQTGAQGPSGDTAAYVAGGTLANASTTALLATGPRTTSYTLAGAVTFTLANGASGQSYTHTLLLVQDSTGGRTVTWPVGVRWHKGVKPTLTTTAGAYDLVHLLWTGAIWVGILGGQALA
ncbi:MAG: hypothetical protein Q8889_02400 [Candidatus Phytoplasma australasiaticum]|nr:hypothetical protein [Candidatus Phytoplasma australasiaticum]